MPLSKLPVALKVANKDMGIKADIQQWDGKATVDLVKIYQAHHQQAGFLSEIIALLNEERCQAAATWLLKRHLETGGEVSAQQAGSILGSLQHLADWPAKLNALQSLDRIPIASDDRAMVEQFLRKQLVSENKFVRAWAYNGFYVLAKQYPEYQAEVQQFFDIAMRDESASVKARIRKVLKKGF